MRESVFVHTGIQRGGKDGKKANVGMLVVCKAYEGR